MLYITFQSPTNPDNNAEVEWHIGEKLHANLTDNRKMPVIEIQADGYELASIHRNFTHIPMAFRNDELVPVQRWYGDMAKFIAFHLPKMY